MTDYPKPPPLPARPPQLAPAQEGRLRIVTAILDRDRSRSTDDLLELMHAVITGDLDGGDDDD